MNSLDEQLNSEFIKLPNVPDYITDNLAYPLREYQKQAIQRFLFLRQQERESSKNYPHLLWQMATGSGKTLIMAALILELYKHGARNFWFFVNRDNIVRKTIDNFLNTASKKYQFSQKIEIDGKNVQIREVTNFTGASKNTVNIKLSTIHELHNGITTPSETSIDAYSFKNIPVILLADEAHHINGATKSQKETENNWESSVKAVLNSNPENRLLEFTATLNIEESIKEKYRDKLIYKYELAKFREDKFSKDVLIHYIKKDEQDIESVMFRAVLISQYRKRIAQKNGINLKPVILFKSKKKTEESKEAYNKFNEMILNLTEEKIKKELALGAGASDIFSKTAVYFQNESYLAEEIKDDFSVVTKRVLIHDSSNKPLPDQDKLVNTLEERNNLVRAIFAVNVLDEGWDVLNLFDIVRLYNGRDGKYYGREYKPGATTISEMQLIGRGARYYPFEIAKQTASDKDIKYKRKFDDMENHPLRVLEQMHYHSIYNPEYITEITQTLHNESKDIPTGTLSEFVPKYIIRHALNKKENFTFEKLKTAYPKLNSTDEFIENLRQKKLSVKGSQNITPELSLYIIAKVLQQVETELKQEQKKVIVSKHFFSKQIKDKFEKEIIRQGKEKELDLRTKEWCVYENHLSTSEETAFIYWFERFICDLKNKGWSEIYLARNENAVKLFSWMPDSLGTGFEPDFILFMEKDKKEYVFYIEPKGDLILGEEKWKEDLLLDIEQVVLTQQQKTTDNKNWMLIGFPFYNEDREKQKTPVFETRFRDFCLS
jgi:hypothetical protein